MVCRHTDWTDCSEYLPSVKTNNNSIAAAAVNNSADLGYRHLVRNIVQETSWTQRVFPTGKIIRYLIVLIIVTCDLCHILDIMLQHTALLSNVQSGNNPIICRPTWPEAWWRRWFVLYYSSSCLWRKDSSRKDTGGGLKAVRCTKWRHISMSRSDSQNIASYNRETGRVTMRGMDNMGLSKDQWTQFSWN